MAYGHYQASGSSELSSSLGASTELAHPFDQETSLGESFASCGEIPLL